MSAWKDPNESRDLLMPGHVASPQPKEPFATLGVNQQKTPSQIVPSSYTQGNNGTLSKRERGLFDRNKSTPTHPTFDRSTLGGDKPRLGTSKFSGPNQLKKFHASSPASSTFTTHFGSRTPTIQSSASPLGFQNSSISAGNSPSTTKAPSSLSFKFHRYSNDEQSKSAFTTPVVRNSTPKFFFKPERSPETVPLKEDKKTTPTKMTQSQLGSSITKIRPVSQPADDTAIPPIEVQSSSESSENESESEGSLSDKSSEEEVIIKKDRRKEMSAREKRRLEYDAVRDQQLPQPASNDETEKQASKRKRLNRELAQLTEWTDWIQETLDKKSEQEKKQAQQLQYQLTPPKKKQKRHTKNTSESSSKTPAPLLKHFSSHSPTIKLNLPMSSSGTPPPPFTQTFTQPTSQLSSRPTSKAYSQSNVPSLSPVLPRQLSERTTSFSKPLAHPHREPPIARTFSQSSKALFTPQSALSSAVQTPVNSSPAQPRPQSCAPSSQLAPSVEIVRPTVSSTAASVLPNTLSGPTSRQAAQYRPSQYPRPLAPAPPKLSAPSSSSTSASSSVSPRPSSMHGHRTFKQFHEPSANEPIMSVTGLSLDAPPNARIKKESLWPKKRPMKRKNNRRKRADSADTDSADETSPEAENADPEVLERELNERLVTQINEQLQRQSEIRSSLVNQPICSDEPTLFAGRYAKSSIPDVQHTSQNRMRGRPPKEDKRKIKNASPKKNRENPFGYDNPLQLAGEKRGTAFDFADTTKDNDDYCYSCGEPGIFLCCESCPKSFHFACCDPPFEESNLPEDEWFCNECYANRHPPIPNKPGLFSKLLDQVERRNPTQFRLPKNIRERFEGVSTGQYGEYEDTGYKPYKPARGAFEQTAPEHHYDKSGQPLLCVKCGKSGISPDKLMGEVDQPIITCEYCPSSWHLDCLNPPLATIKQLGKKWKCPNHADTLYEQRRRVKNPTIIDVDLPRGFRNDGNVDIMLESDESDSDTEMTCIQTPPYFDTYDTPDGVAALPCKAQRKLWKDDFAIFRLPERGVVLDFMGKIHERKEAIRNAKIDEYYKIARDNQKLLKKLTSEGGDADKHAVASLIELKESDFKELVEVAAEALGDTGSSVEENQADSLQDGASLSAEEVDELLQIKKLMSLKGKDKLLEFLKHQ